MPELRTSAYYTYTLLLNASGWAWEFLRRNLLYRHAWALERKAERRALARPSGVRPRAPRDRASPWGLRFLEPPHLTGLEVVPFWRTDAIPAPARAGIVAGAAPASELFDLFAEPGDKAVCLTPEGALAVIEIGRTTVRLRFADPAELRDQLPLEVRMAETPSDTRERDAALRFVHRGTLAAAPAGRYVPGNVVRLMQQLQALDGRLAGAGPREIAEAVYGPEVVARDWSNPDGLLQRRTHYLIERGTALMSGAYRTLLKPLRTLA